VRILAAARPTLSVALACGSTPATEGLDASAPGSDASSSDAPAPPADGQAPKPDASQPGADAASDASDAAIVCAAPATHQGGLTQYDQTSANNCGVPWPSDNLYAAISTPDYDSPTPRARAASASS